MRKYQTPTFTTIERQPALPTLLAVGAASAVASAAVVGLSKLVGDDRTAHKDKNLPEIEE